MGFMEKKRNIKVDILRGFAAVIVVLGHTLMLYPGHPDSLLLNVIWAIQIPLFMLLSGFSQSYSAPIRTGRDFGKFTKKRLSSVLWPWFVWSAIAYLVFAGNVDLWAYIGVTAYHMESAFWFVFSLFTINLVFALASLGAAMVKTEKLWLQKLVTVALCVAGAGLLLGIGLFTGINFLGIKYTAYYIPYFVLGWLVGGFVESNAFPRFQKYYLDKVLLILLIVFCVLVGKHNFFTMQDSPINILIRVIASSCVSLLLVGLMYKMDGEAEAKLERIFRVPAKYSLELYVVQYFVLHFLTAGEVSVLTVTGFLNCMAYFAIVYGLCVFLIWFLHLNPLVGSVFFGKVQKSRRRRRVMGKYETKRL